MADLFPKLTKEERKELRDLARVADIGGHHPSRIKKQRVTQGKVVRLSRAQRNVRGTGYALPKELKLAIGVQRTLTRFSAPQRNRKGWAAHAAYLEREGAGEGGERAVAFGSAGDSVSLKGLARTWADEADEWMWKLIVSPDPLHSHKIDMKVMVRDLMARMEEDLETKLEWGAVVHSNTENPHAHIMIRGRNDRGSALRIAPNYIKEGARKRNSDWLTQQLGFRTEKDMIAQREIEVSSYAMTGLDTELLKLQVKHGHVLIKPPQNPSFTIQARQGHLFSRLDFLKRMGMAKKVKGQWTVEPNLSVMMRAYAQARNRQTALAKGQAFLTRDRAELVATTIKEPGTWLAGKVLNTGLDEASERIYFLVEAIDGKIHYCLEQTKRAGGVALKVGRTYEFEVRADKKRPDDTSEKVFSTLHINEHPEHAPALIDRYLARTPDGVPDFVEGKGYAAEFSARAYVRAQQLRREKGLTPIEEQEFRRHRTVERTRTPEKGTDRDSSEDLRGFFR